MSKKVLCFSVLFLSVLINKVSALQISEINFDPSGTDSGREWIEIYNHETSTISDFTNYKFFEANVNHSIGSTQSDKSIGVGEYIVIVQDVNKFKIDYPNYVGKIFESSFSLSNTGETLAIKNSSGDIKSEVTYVADATNNNGNSVHNSGSLFGGIATPGNTAPQNNVSSGSNSTSTVSTSTTSTSTVSTTTTKEEVFTPSYVSRTYFPAPEKVYLNIGENIIVPLGKEIEFEMKVLNGDKKSVEPQMINWSFGDGEVSTNKKQVYSYKLTGEYTVIGSVSYNGVSAEDRIYVKVVDPKIKISLGEDKNYLGENKFVEIKNNSTDSVDVGGFILLDKTATSTVSYTLPNKFSILPKKSVKITFDKLKFSTTTKSVTFTTNKNLIIDEFKSAIQYETVLNDTLSVATNTKLSLVNSKKKNFLKKTISVNNKNSNVAKMDIEPKKLENKENSNKVTISEPTKNSFLIKVKNLIFKN